MSATLAHSRLCAFFALAITAFSAVTPARAAEIAPGVTLDTEIRAQSVALHNGDLGTSGEDTLSNAALAARFQLTAHFTPDDFFFWEGRAVASAGEAGFESGDTGALSNGDSFLEWRQSFLEFDHIRNTPFGAKLGRQKIREDYGLWWNQNFDAVQGFYDTTIFRGTLTAGEDLFSYRTSGDDFSENDKDVANLLAEGQWQYFHDSFLEARLMLQNDHSDLRLGQVQDADDLDRATGDYAWAGLRAAGKTRLLSSGTQKTAYRFDLLAVEGDESVATTAVFGPGTRIVTALDDQDVRGWALDGSLDIPLQENLPVLHFGYAFGSGDNNPADADDDSFRQSGLHGNFSRIGELTENTDNYGTALRPELSNIHVISAGGTMKVLDGSDAGIIYRYYRLDEPATSLMASGVLNTLNGSDRDLGQEVDFLFNMDVQKETGFTVSQVKDIKLRSSLGFFRAGDAFGTADGDVAVRGLVELKIKL